MNHSLSRRDFLKSSAALTLGLGIASLFPSAASAEASTAESAGYDISNTVETDVVICGAGAAGMQAAMTIVEAGLSCIVLEKGGSLSVSNGSMAGGPALAETPTEAENGEDVPVRRLFLDLYSFTQGTVDGALLKKAVEQSRRVYDHFNDNGITLGLQPDKWGLGYRCRHNFLGPDGKVVRGAARYQPLADYIEANGGQIIFNQDVQHLVCEDGVVRGVIAMSTEDSSCTQYLAKAVLLSTGGYLGNKEKLNEHFGPAYVHALGNTLSTGEAIDMGREIGALVGVNWGICGNEMFSVNEKIGAPGLGMKNASSNLQYAHLGGLIVNKDGERFMDEQYMADAAGSVGAEAVLRQGKYYAIIDDEFFKTVRTEGICAYYGNTDDWYVGRETRNEPLPNNEADLEKDISMGWAFKADTIQELAEHFGLTNLAATVEEYNRFCEAGEDKQFYKSPYLLKALTTGPFYAFEYQSSAWCTYGGLHVTSNCEVTNEMLEPIKGLYAAGVDAANLFTSPYYALGGASLGLSLTSGIVAGDAIVNMIQG